MDSDSLTTSDHQQRERRWFHPKPAWLLFILLTVEGVLLLSERFQWFPFNTHKGWTVLIAIASIGVTMVLMLLWFLLALCFRRRFQFSIRAMLFAVVVIAVPFSWLAVEMKKAKEQQEVVEEIHRLGGRTVYDYEEPPRATPVPAPHRPMWLQKLLDEDFFSDVDYVDFTDTKVADKDLENLKALPQLRELSLSNTKVTDNGLEHLKALTRLRGLWLTDTKVTDEGLTNIEALTQLRVLSIKSTKVTDRGLENLKALTKLRALSLAATKVTDKGLEHLKALTQLEWLQVDNTTVTDRGLVSLEALTQLRTLLLFGTEVTDRGVKELQKALPNCSITH
jgi:hypothetical protein